MRLLFVASEAFPLVKTGGLADVAGALPQALARLGADCRLLLPAYPEALEALGRYRAVASVGDPYGAGQARLLEGRLGMSRRG